MTQTCLPVAILYVMGILKPRHFLQILCILLIINGLFFSSRSWTMPTHLTTLSEKFWSGNAPRLPTTILVSQLVDLRCKNVDPLINSVHDENKLLLFVWTADVDPGSPLDVICFDFVAQLCCKIQAPWGQKILKLTSMTPWSLCLKIQSNDRRFFFCDDIKLWISALLKFESARCQIFLIVFQSTWTDSVTDFIAPMSILIPHHQEQPSKEGLNNVPLLWGQIWLPHPVIKRGYYSRLIIRSGHGDKKLST